MLILGFLEKVIVGERYHFFHQLVIPQPQRLRYVDGTLNTRSPPVGSEVHMRTLQAQRIRG